MISYNLRNIDGFSAKFAQIFDAFYYAVGYELRLSFIRSSIITDINYCYLDYESVGLGDYDENKRAAVDRNDDPIPVKNMNIKELVSDRLISIRKGDSAIHLGVDVSCLDRSLMSSVILGLIERMRPDDTITFLYTPSAFQEPPLFLAPLRKFGAAIPELAGSTGNPYKDRTLIMGLGYEYGAALNAIELIEPQYIQMFYPVGGDERYVPLIRRANFDFDFGGSFYDISEYNLNDPVALHGRIRDLVYSIKHHSSVIIVPFGPKLFSSVCILIAMNNLKDVSFMRYSVESIDYFERTESSGDILGYQMTLNRV